MESEVKIDKAVRRAGALLACAVVVLVAVGIVMLASTSSVKGVTDYGDPQYFLNRQLIWLAASLTLSLMVRRVDYRVWRRFWIPLFLLALFLLVLVFVKGIGVKVGGSHRWISLMGLSFQPSEFAKVMTVVALAAWMERTGRRVSTFLAGALFPVMGLGLVAGLLMLEPDFGTTMLVGAVGMCVMFVGGSRPIYLAMFGVAGLSLFVMAVMDDPVRMGRILAFIMPEKYPATAHHLAQSKVSFILGGPWGVGLGNSIQKHLYLPEAHNDFILAIIGEELGLMATGGLLLLYAVVAVCGTTISLKSPDIFGKLLGMGLTALLTLQAAINMGVVTGCLPTKGLPLPFISYGGSSMMGAIAAVAILLSIARSVERVQVNAPVCGLGSRALRL